MNTRYRGDPKTGIVEQHLVYAKFRSEQIVIFHDIVVVAKIKSCFSILFTGAERRLVIRAFVKPTHLNHF